MIELVLLGVVAGALTTVAGLGGGMLLVAVLGVLRGPHEALAITAPALLVSNLHRAWLFRADLQLKTAKRFALGAIPGAAIAGYLVPEVPALFLALLLTSATLFTLARVHGLVSVTVSPRCITPAGVGVGVLGATSGGGVLIAPLLLSTGLRGSAYIGTAALASALLHSGRVVGYVAGGALGTALLASVAVLLGGLLAGNLAGQRLRARLSGAMEGRLETGALVSCAAISIAAALR